MFDVYIIKIASTLKRGSEGKALSVKNRERVVTFLP